VGRREKGDGVLLGGVLLWGTAAWAAIRAAAPADPFFALSCAVLFGLACLAPRFGFAGGEGPWEGVCRSLVPLIVLLPFFALCMSSVPVESLRLVRVLLFLAVEAVFWSWLFSASGVLYCFGVGFMGLLPLVWYSLAARAAGAVHILAVSPAGLLYILAHSSGGTGGMRGEIWTGTAVHGVLLACSFVPALFGGRKADEDA